MAHDMRSASWATKICLKKKNRKTLYHHFAGLANYESNSLLCFGYFRVVIFVCQIRADVVISRFSFLSIHYECLHVGMFTDITELHVRKLIVEIVKSFWLGVMSWRVVQTLLFESGIFLIPLSWHGLSQLRLVWEYYCSRNIFKCVECWVTVSQSACVSSDLWMCKRIS